MTEINVKRLELPGTTVGKLTTSHAFIHKTYGLCLPCGGGGPNNKLEMYSLEKKRVVNTDLEDIVIPIKHVDITYDLGY